jgi:hypothetical protein
MDNGKVRGCIHDLPDGSLTLPVQTSRDVESSPAALRPKLSFGSWAMTEDRARTSAGEQCEANR